MTGAMEMQMRRELGRALADAARRDLGWAAYAPAKADRRTDSIATAPGHKAPDLMRCVNYFDA